MTNPLTVLAIRMTPPSAREAIRSLSLRGGPYMDYERSLIRQYPAYSRLMGFKVLTEK